MSRGRVRGISCWRDSWQPADFLRWPAAPGARTAFVGALTAFRWCQYGSSGVSASPETLVRGGKIWCRYSTRTAGYVPRPRDPPINAVLAPGAAGHRQKDPLEAKRSLPLGGLFQFKRARAAPAAALARAHGAESPRRGMGSAARAYEKTAARGGPVTHPPRAPGGRLATGPAARERAARRKSVAGWDSRDCPYCPTRRYFSSGQ